MKTFTRGGLIAATAITAIAVNAGTASAGSFQLNERSTKALGAALSGSVSAASDVTFATFNPAALKTVEHLEMGGNISGILLESDATVQNGPFAGVSNSAGRDAIVPSFAMGYRLTDDIVVGFTTYSPFGLKSEYNSLPFIADARTSELRTVVFAPSISYDVLDNLTLGASLDLLYADARLTNAAVNLSGNEFGIAFSVGALFEPVEGTQIGAAYHHGYNLGIETNVFGGAFPPAFGLEGVASAQLPNWAHIGVTQSVTDDLRVMVEGRWIDWSDFDRIDVSGPSPTGGFAFSDVQGYDDGFFVSAGAEYDVTEEFTIRGGVAFDGTPTNDQFRTPRVADEDRLWLSVGASYELNESMSVDFAYNFLTALEDPDVTLRNGAVAGTRLKYDSTAHIFSIGGSLKF